MSNKRTLTTAISLAVALASSFVGSAGAQGFQNPPAPQPVYIVTQRLVDGTVIMTDRAVEFIVTDFGCVKYRHPNDNAAVLRYPRFVCGSPISIAPEPR